MADREPIYLPRVDDAVIPAEKLRDYALNPDHVRGGHKARVMRSALGLTRDDWTYLRDQIREGARTTRVTRVVEHRNGTFAYGIVIDVLGRNGKTAAVTTGWFQGPG
ncbi:MAG: DUF6883 domain-containing protein, partial [Jatrophihabitantaceae bacterium]